MFIINHFIRVFEVLILIDILADGNVMWNIIQEMHQKFGTGYIILYVNFSCWKFCMHGMSVLVNGLEIWNVRIRKCGKAYDILVIVESDILMPEMSLVM